jgi:hypothetical protein
MRRPPFRLCHARTRAGGRCRRPALPDRLRCKLHGAFGGRPRGIPLRPAALAARVQGRARWIERMRLAKQRGLIAKIPGGRKPRGSAKRSQDKYVVKAQRIVERKIEMAKKKPTVPAVPAVAPKAWDEMTEAERLKYNTNLALTATKTILELEVDPTNLKLLGHIKDTALQTISQQIKVDERQLTVPAVRQHDEVLERLSEGLRKRLQK